MNLTLLGIALGLLLAAALCLLLLQRIREIEQAAVRREQELKGRLAALEARLAAAVPSRYGRRRQIAGALKSALDVLQAVPRFGVKPPPEAVDPEGGS